MFTIERSQSRTIARMTGKSKGRPTVGTERNDVLRTLMRALIQRDFSGNLTATAHALVLSPSSLSAFLSGSRGAGPKTTDALVTYTRCTYDQILASGGDLDALRASGVSTSPVQRAVFRELPNWNELLAGAKEIEPRLLPWVWEAVAEAPVWFSGVITSGTVAGVGRFVSECTPPPSIPTSTDRS